MPWWCYAVAVSIGAVVWIWKGWRHGALAAYAFVLVAATVLLRRGGASFQYDLRPLWSWAAWNVQGSQILANVIAFVPVGLLAGSLWRWRGILVGMGLSVVIELSQLLAKRGLCEFDDVLHNTVGAAIGVFIVMAVTYAIERVKHRRHRGAHSAQ